MVQTHSQSLKSFITAFFLLFLCFSASAQTKKGDGKKKIEILNANSLAFQKGYGGDAKRLKGDVKFRHNDMIMTCDSAYFYEDRNALEAFSNVRVTQGDSFLMTGDNLIYNGDTRQATVTGDVMVRDNEMTLRTDAIQYDMKNKVGTYVTGGTIVTDNNKLTSKRGIYNVNSKEFYFRKDVVLNNEEYTMYSDTLRYNSATEIAYFYGPTTIESEDNTIYCEYGWYDTRNEVSQFSKGAKIVTDENTLTADSMVYYRNVGLGRAYKNIVMIDTVQDVKVMGDFGQYNRNSKTTIVTKNPIAYKYFDNDSMLVTSDTLFYIQNQVTGEERLSAYHQAKIYKSDMQGVCDSLAYSFSDSSITMLGTPIIWSDVNQLTADTTIIYMKENKIDKMDLIKNAFIASEEDTIHFNQIRGKNMEGFFINSELDMVNVMGNGQSINYDRVDSVTLRGVNIVDCSNMRIDVDSNELVGVTYLEKPNAHFYPMDKVPQDQLKLKGFVWYPHLRPTEKDMLRNEEE